MHEVDETVCAVSATERRQAAPTSDQPRPGKRSSGIRRGARLDTGVLALVLSIGLPAIFGVGILLSADVLTAANCPDHSSQCVRPIELGVSGINLLEVCSAGTLGSLVDAGGARLIMSNNHVMARENNAVAGQEPIVQPGTLDNGCVRDIGDAIGVLVHFIPINFAGGTNVFDLALARTDPSLVNPNGEILGIGLVNPAPFPGTPPVGTAVKKAGRTTAVTSGQISAVNVSVLVTYSTGTAFYQGQYRVTPGSFSAAGDSGSLIVEDTASCPRAIGLLFAGSATSTLGNPINRLFEATGLRVVGDSTCAAGQATAPSISDAEMARAVEVQARHERSILAMPGVVGIGIGLPDAGQRPVIEIYVERAGPDEARRFPPDLEGLPVRIIETGPFRAFR